MNSNRIQYPAPDTPDDHSADERVAAVADEFTERLERGERPDVDEYVSRYPDIADVIRDVLPAIQLMQIPGAGVLSGSGASTEDSPHESMSGQLGDFRILREIGRGGMGVVYEAEQISLGRRVALKVLPFAAALDSKHLERFKREAQAAAHLHHTNIVPVYSVGCERGVYYYAMQFIEGQSLAEVIAQLHRQTEQHAPVATPAMADSAALTHADQFEDSPAHLETQSSDRAATQLTATVAMASTEQSLIGNEFFQSVAMFGVQAADALEHAHSLGIVHRDIKPANLLLDANAHLFVTDFGLAQYQADGNLTLTGDMVGTLRYMSPEQALLNRTVVDHRTDIYSLGATLYELLTLTPLWDTIDRRQLLNKIAFDDPVPPRRLNKKIPADLETILQKALAKEPQDRYASASDLSDDLRRFLEHKTIRARRPTLTERAAKWSRRHRTIVISAVVLLVMAVAGLSVSNLFIANERSNTAQAYTLLAAKQKETAAAYKAEADQRARAEHNFQQARQMLDFFVQVSEEELADTPEVQEVRRKLLEASLGYYREFLKHCGDDPAARAQLAASLFRLASILNRMDNKPDALAAFEQAREVQEQLVREHPNDTNIQRGLFSIYRHMGVLRGSEHISLLAQSSVREHLIITPQQIDQINALSEQRRDSYRNFYAYRNKSRDEIRALFQERARATQKELSNILNSDQLRRLDQISLQLRGTQAFSSPEIAEAIGLTDTQIEAIHKIKEDAYRALRNMYFSRRRHARSRDHSKELFRKTYRGTNEKLLGLLTTEQMTAWRNLAGEPFNGELRFEEHGHGKFHFGHGRFGKFKHPTKTDKEQTAVLAPIPVRENMP